MNMGKTQKARSIRARKEVHKMKTIEEMTYEELKQEIKYTVSLMDDDAQAQHSAAYLADLTEAFAKKVSELWK